MVAAVNDFVSDAELEAQLRQSVSDDGVRMRAALSAAISFVEGRITDAILDTERVTYDAVYRPGMKDDVISLPVSFVQSARIAVDDAERVNLVDLQAVSAPGGAQAHVVGFGRDTHIRPPIGGWPEDVTSGEGDFRIALQVGATASDIDPSWKFAALELTHAYYVVDMDNAEAEARASSMLDRFYRYQTL